MNCVNALKRATLISTKAIFAAKIENTMCQCPERGDTHFYDAKPETVVTGFSGVNALKGATLIST